MLERSIHIKCPFKLVRAHPIRNETNCYTASPSGEPRVSAAPDCAWKKNRPAEKTNPAPLQTKGTHGYIRCLQRVVRE